ncbi:MAG: ABC transporter ATP-binding protein, partial [Bacteroidota bacterium]
MSVNQRQSYSQQPGGIMGGPRRGGPFGGHGPGGFGRPVEKPKNFKKTFKRLLQCLRPHRAKLFVVLVFAIASTTFAIFSPKIMGKAMNKMQDGFMARMVIQRIAAAQRKAVQQINTQMRTLGRKPAEAEGFATPSMDTIIAVRRFMKLPMLDQVKDPDQKAEICLQLIELGKKMAPLQPKAEPGAMPELKLTQVQIDGAIKAIRETNGKIDFKYIGRIAIILIGIYIISALFSLITGLVMAEVSQRTVYQMRKDVDAKLAKLPLKYFDSRPHGEILSRVTNDMDTISNSLQQSLTQIITSIVSILGYIIMMLTISPFLTLLVVATLPIYVLATVSIAKRSQKYFASQQKSLGELSGHVEEMYTGHRIVKAFGREKDSLAKFEAVNGRLYEAGRKAQFVSGIMFPLMNFISNLGYVFICVAGGIWITKNRLKIGDVTAFIQYARSFTMPMVHTANIANIIQSTVACAERVFEVLDEQEEIPDSPDSKALAPPRGQVDLEEVDFRYVEDVPLIENMNLQIKAGDTIAIVGPTGAGKTTLVNLLMR